MKLIVGLGNPGRGYAHNRHNIGFMCLSHFARKQGIRFDRQQGKARIGTGEFAGDKLILAKPQTYINLSGESVSRLVKKFEVNLDDLLVIQDDLDLPLGKIRLRYGSGSGGHNGVASLIDALGSQDFCRLRVGIGRPISATGPDIISYVLGDFTSEEKRIINQVIPIVSEAILHFLTEGLTSAMNRYN
ncbi:MAG: aminoacyl-tRNA hydrolase [Dehalococcoidales bacterium]|nr:aminoacyl-tRNA hydrolase [Dehalococcoidales bacterium]